MGFLDSLGDTMKKMGSAAVALPGAVYDTATYVIPGDQWGGGDDSGFSGLLNSLGSRAGDLTFAVPAPIKQSLSGTMDVLNTAYHEGIDQPLSTAMIMASHLDPGSGGQDSGAHYGDLFSSEAWSKAYGLAEHQSFGQSTVDALSSADDPFARSDAAKGAEPFDTNEWVKNHPFIANAGALGTDLAVSWYLDPTVLAGKAAGVARQDLALGRIRPESRADFAKRLDGSLVGTEKTFGVATDWAGRFDRFFDHIDGANKLKRPLNAAEIRASSIELQKSSGGLAISAALEDAMKLDPAVRKDAARRVFAVAAGDLGSIERLKTETAGTAALADRLKNIVGQKTLDLSAQALNRARTESPEFRAAFDAQITNLDETGDLSKFVRDWHAKVDAENKGNLLLGDTAGSLTHLPDVHKGPFGTSHKLKLAAENDALSKTERGHDAIVDRLTGLPKRDSYSTVYQKGLGSLPVMAVYPAKFMAALLPTKALPVAIRGLRTVHYNGVANLHDWNAASDQLNSMMIHAGVDNETRLKQLSEVYGARNESDRLAVIHRTEQVAMDGIAKSLSAKHGIEIDRDFIQQSMIQGQQSRGRMISAMNGGRIYSTTAQPADMAMRTRNVAKARQQATIDNKLAAEGSDASEHMAPRVDQFLDSTGSPFTMPVVSSQLANRVPLLDVPLVKQMTSDAALAKRLKTHGDMWAETAIEKRGLEARLARATGSQYDRLAKQLMNVRKTQDMLLGTASVFNRWWKVSVLFRLGYPMRVVADDHMRIAARIGYIPFLMANAPEGIKNSFYNYMPGIVGGGRARDAAVAYEATKARRAALVAHFGRDTAPTDREWAELPELHKTYFNPKATDAERAKVKARLDKIDPDGRVTEYADLQRQAVALRRSIASRRAAVTRWENEGGQAEKINAAQREIIDAEGALAHTTEQLAGRVDPSELRSQIKQMTDSLRTGPKNFRADKRHVGEADVSVDGTRFEGAFASSAHGWHEAVSSNHSFDYILTDGEDFNFRLNQAGHWRSVSPGEPGYYQLWANILNHQFQHSPEFMSIVRGDVKDASEFSSWLRKGENRHIRERMAYYAHNPQDWGERLLAMTHDYIPSDELMGLVKNGRVSARQLQRLFGEGDQRLPNLHGQLADIQSGRAGVQRAMSNGIQRAFEYISTKPTDALSRHPFFNAIYKREVKQAAAAHIAAKGKGSFSEADVQAIESLARRKALGELKQTLWDVSAHSHAAHVMRFLSPFFAAHQEALNRWWQISKDDPSIARHFQLAFDAPRKAGLTTDDEGNVVDIGESIGPGHHIMLKLPFADDKNSVNKWLRRVGGGKYWSINENGLNLILQNGLANPGIGPVVTIPVEGLVQKYPEATEFEKAARVLNQYPPVGDNFKDIAIGAVVPAWSKRVWAAYRGPKSAEFGRYYLQNFADDLTTFRLQNDREPSENELKGLEDKANRETHLDLVLMGLSNAAFITPAKPNSRYAVVQDGLQRLYDQMRSQGKDMEWLRSTFRAQYGDAYMAMIYSMGSNPAHLEGSVGEVSAIKKYNSLMKHIDPSLARLVIGPEADAAEKSEKVYSSSAASWLSGQETGKAGVNYRGSKDPREVAASLVVSQGWDQYDELTNYLDVLADQRGEGKGYEAYPDLVNVKRQGVDVIKQSNPVFAHSYDEYSQRSFDKIVDDMRLISSNKQLLGDPTRSNDVMWLGRYIELRDYVTATLRQRAASGGAKTIGAQDNADLADFYRNAIQYINTQSPYFKTYVFGGTVEHDPLLVNDGGQ